MAKPKKAKLKIGGSVPVVTANLKYGTETTLDVEGRTLDASTIRIHVRMFFRVKGVPFCKTIKDHTTGALAADTAFNLAAPVPFIPRNKTDLTFQVLAWDTQTAAVMPKRMKDVRKHAARARVR